MPPPTPKSPAITPAIAPIASKSATMGKSVARSGIGSLLMSWQSLDRGFAQRQPPCGGMLQLGQRRVQHLEPSTGFVGTL